MTDPALAIEDLSVRYIGRRDPALEDVSLSVAPGDVVGVVGRTRAGKSTLALVGAGFIPRVVRARVGGQVRIEGADALTAGLADLAGKVGVVFSSPALQLSSSKPTVREELAFGLENLAVPRAEMDGRIDAVLDRLGIAHLAEREPLALSGGEQQRVAIASILVMGTGLLVLDEPTAQLDPAGTADVAGLLAELAADGRAILVAEHDPEVLRRAERCLVLDGGRVVGTGPPAVALGSSIAGRAGLVPPTLVALAEAAGVPPEAAFDEELIAGALMSRRPTPPPALTSTTLPDVPTVRAAPVEPVELRGVVYRYPGGVEALRGVSLSITPGEAVAIVGQNGSGKTTLVKHLNGLLRPAAGSVLVGGRDLRGRRVSDVAGQVGFVFQNPDDQLFHGRVDQEVGFGPRNLRLSAEQIAALVDAALTLVGLGPERATNPYDLGFSMRKLVALASVLAMEPPLLVLDEPTTGQDGPGVERVGAIVDAWVAAGRTVVAITHDMEFAARHFARTVVMREGQIVFDGPPAEVFAPDQTGLLASTGLLPPPAARVAARLGLARVPADTASLLDLLATG